MNLYEKILPKLSSALNEIHNTTYPVSYWRIIVGPWLIFFTQILYDRWQNIHLALNKYDIIETTILDFKVEHMIPNDMSAFHTMYRGDKWNHFIFSEIIKNTTDISFVKKSRAYKSHHFNNKEERVNFKQKIKRKLTSLLYLFTKDDEPFFISTYLSILNELKLSLMLGKMPQINYTPKTRTIYPNIKNRGWEINLKGDSRFENYLLKTIPVQIPTIYLEGYSTLTKQLKSTLWPKKPKLIWTSNSDMNDEYFKAYAAEKKVNGSHLVLGQHGGHYGIGLFDSNEAHQLKISDSFLSWGWKDINISKVKPVGSLIQRSNNIKFYNNKSLVMTTLGAPRFSFRLLSMPIAGQWLKYQKNLYTFCDLLKKEMIQDLIVRNDPSDFGWNQKYRWVDYNPSIKLDNGTRSIHKLFNKCRISIHTYNATTYLESLSLNIPTVIFWDPYYFEMRTSAEPYFDILENVGVYHKSPEAAALHINKIYKNVKEWWFDKETRSAVKLFCDNYANNSTNLSNSLYNTFSNLPEMLA